MKNLQKRMSVFMVFVLFIAILPVPTYANTEKEKKQKIQATIENIFPNEIPKTMNIEYKKIISEIKYGGNPIGTSAWYQDEYGQTQPAYCIDPYRKGVSSSLANYDVSITGANTDPVIAGVLLSGYPHKSPTELGLSTIDEAYAATKGAVWASLQNSPYANISLWSSPNPKVKEAMLQIMEDGKNYGTVNLALYSMAKKDYNKTTDYIEQSFYPEANYDIISYQVKLKGDYPSATKILNKDGNEQSIFTKDEPFTVHIPTKGLPENSSGNVQTDIMLKLKSDVVLVGTPLISERVQRYDIPKTPQLASLSTSTPYSTLSLPIEEEGNLKIIKREAGTTKGLAGAVFEVKDPKGKLIGTFQSNSDGEVNIAVPVQGKYSVTEIVPPSGYQLDKNNHQDIIIQTGTTAELTFSNHKNHELEIEKIDAETGEPLANAVMKIELDGGHEKWELITDLAGKAKLSDLADGTYKITEILSPKGYILNDEPIYVKLEAGKPTHTIVIKNEKEPTIRLEKRDKETGLLIDGAEFRLTTIEGVLIWEGIVEDGVHVFDGLEEGWYIVTEINPPSGYIKCDEPKKVFLEGGKSVQVKFDNEKKPSLSIYKKDSVTGKPLEGVVFKIRQTDGETVSEYITDESGVIFIENLDVGTYTIEEIMTLDGYILDTEHTDIILKAGDNKSLVYDNTKKPTLIITKLNAVTEKGVPNTTFKIEYEQKDGGVKKLGTYKTDTNGQIILKDVEVGWYIATEIKPAQGMGLPSNPVTRIYLSKGENAYLDTGSESENHGNEDNNNSGNNGSTPSNQDIVVTSGFDYVNEQGEIIENYPLNSLIIKKIDKETSEMLADAVFEVRKVDGGISGTSGTIIGRYTTDTSGIIVITGLEAGAYLVEEVKAPKGYIINENSIQHTWLKADGTSVVELTFANTPYGSVVVSKIDEDTKEPLKGAIFKVTDGQGGVLGSENGRYETDINGEFIIKDIKPSTTIIVTEEKAPTGYTLNSTPQTLHIGMEGKTYKLTFTNKIKSAVQIIKIDADTKAPLKGVGFRIYHKNGEVVGDYITDKDGLIIVDGLSNGWYKAVETKELDGYIRDDTAQDFEVTGNQFIKLTFENKALASLLIIKIDSKTGKALKGVEFLVSKSNGERIGYFKTDDRGRIYINNLESDITLHIIETKPLDGYEANDEVYEVDIKGGKQAELRVENTPKSGIRIIKLDSLSKKGIEGVEFRLYDFRTGEEIAGPFYSDNNGVVDFIGEIPEGRYKIIETKEKDGYIRDSQPKTVEFRAGEYTEITWYNTPLMGQVQVTKVSSADNEYNGLPKGTKLEGAVFEIYDFYTGNLIDQFKTASNGVGSSKPIPLGRYILKEVKSPSYYKISDKEVDFEIRFSTEIVKIEFANEPANTGVYIKKVGPVETMNNTPVKYTFEAIQNQSTVPLSDFYWRDILPTTAIRLNKIQTGTYNQGLRYKIVYKTNLNQNYRVMADNLSSTQNHLIDCSNASLGLHSNEFVSEFMFVFGTVKAGFSSVEKPAVYASTLNNLSNGFQFSNRADIGGKYNGEWVIGNTTWLTTIYTTSDPKLPKTGY